MPAFAFYLFAGVTILSALFVVLNRDAVNSAMCMIVALAGVAVLFGLLNAYVLAGFQIIVYAGAVMVLFLFIIMLLDPGTRLRPVFTPKTLLNIGVVGIILVASALWLAHQFPQSIELPAAPQLPPQENPMAFATAVKALGMELFTRYLLPFEVAGFMLLVAMLGVIVLSKRTPAEPQKSKTSTDTR